MENNWFLENIRLSLFAKNFDLELLSLGKFYNTSSNYVLNKSSKKITETDFDENGLQITFSITETRIDLILSEILLLNKKADFNLKFTPTVEIFKKIIFEDFLPKLNFNEFQRIAIGTVGIQKIETFKEGLENLKFYLPYIQIDIENSKDFLFQINKPKNIDVLNRNININQITKWSVMEYKYLVVNNNLIQNLLGNQFGFRLETDINTAQDENTNKSKEFVKSIIEKEIQTSIDYFDKGDTNVNTNYA